MLPGNIAEALRGGQGLGGAFAARGAGVLVSRSEIHGNQAVLGGGLHVERGAGGLRPRPFQPAMSTQIPVPANSAAAAQRT